MKKKFILIFLLFLIPIVSAGVIKIGVKMEVKGNISAVVYNASNGVLKIAPEFYNTGSVAYKSRIRLLVENSTDVIFTGWSKEETVMPGERKNFEIYWYTPMTKNIVTRLRTYYGKEIIEREIRLKMENDQITEDVFQIKNFRTYDNYIKFQITSNKSLNNILIIPKNYLMGWVFEQKKMGNLDENKNIEVIIPYEAEVWLPHELSIDAVTEDGKYYSSFSFNLQKEEGLLKYVHYITDKINLVFNI